MQVILEQIEKERIESKKLTLPKQIQYFGNKKRSRERKQYVRLRSVGKACRLGDPVYLDEI